MTEYGLKCSDVVRFISDTVSTDMISEVTLQTTSDVIVLTGRRPFAQLFIVIIPNTQVCMCCG